MIEGGAVLVHVTAHDHGDFAIGSHGAVGDFPVAHVARLNAAAPVFGEWRRRADNQGQVDQTRIDSRGHGAQKRYGTRAARSAAEEKAGSDAKDLGNFFRPERLRIGGGNRRSQSLALKVLEAKSRIL